MSDHTTSTVPMASSGALPSASLLDQMAIDGPRGVSHDPNDLLTPLLSLLQNGSPQCNARDPAYIAGAEPGHWYLRNAVNPIRSGIDGILVIPCGQCHAWIEFAPQRAGFVARYETPPTDLTETRSENGRRPISVRSTNGNPVEHVRELYLLIDLQPYLFSCSSTKHQFARELQTHLHQYRHPKTGQVLPAFSRKYLLTSIPASNGLGQWFKPKFEDLGWVSESEYAKAREFAAFIERGNVRGDYRTDTTDD